MRVDSHRKKFDGTKLLKYIIFLPIAVVCVLFQVSFLDVFGKTPAIALALVCAVGFHNDERLGGVIGLCSGFLLDMLGGVGFSLSPLFYMLSGYLCGYFPRIFLRRNFPSYMIYTCIAGVCRACLTLMYYTLRTRSFNIIQIFSKTLVPEFFAFIVCVPLTYALCFGIARFTNRHK